MAKKMVELRLPLEEDAGFGVRVVGGGKVHWSLDSCCGVPISQGKGPKGKKGGKKGGKPAPSKKGTKKKKSKANLQPVKVSQNSTATELMRARERNLS